MPLLLRAGGGYALSCKVEEYGGIVVVKYFVVMGAENK